MTEITDNPKDLCSPYTRIADSANVASYRSELKAAAVLLVAREGLGQGFGRR